MQAIIIIVTVANFNISNVRVLPGRLGVQMYLRVGSNCFTCLWLNCCPDNTKLAYHRHAYARYKMEWIYTQAKVRSPGNIELAREEKIRRLRFLHFLWFPYSWFRHTRLFQWTVWGLIDRYFGVDYECESLKS